MIELQSHSVVSDGELAPIEVVSAAAAAGVSVIALTDHDAVDGVQEAGEAAERAGLTLVPAVELSAAHPVAEELHVLGYWIDLDAIAPVCERAQRERVVRAGEIVERLRQAGFELTLEDAIAEAGDAASVGRPHIARAAGATDMKPFFERYLVPGAEAYVPRRWPTAADAVRLIHEAGGVAVLAHPFWDLDDADDVGELVTALEWDGVECFYPSHSREQSAFLVGLCREEGLFVTASSDYHGPSHKLFSRFGAYDTFGLGQPELPPRVSTRA